MFLIIKEKLKKMDSKKQVKDEPKVDLNIESNNMGNKMKELASKIEEIDRQLKAQLQVFKTVKNPTSKAQAKRKAMQLLKKKKTYEQLYNNLSSAQDTLESVNINNEIMKNNKNVMQAMKNAVDEQKANIKSIGGIDKLYDYMDNIAELREQQQIINDEVQKNLEDHVGDEDLNAELDDLDYQNRVDLNEHSIKPPVDDINGNNKINEDNLDDLLK